MMGLTKLNVWAFFCRTPHYLFLIFCLSLVVRLIFVLKFPELGGDADIYLLVAGNIIGGCGVAISPIDSGTCVPHFGGNQGPGYPLFIALNWILSDNSNLVVRLTQSIIVCMSVVYFVHAIEKFLQSEKKAFIIGCALAISPCAIAWSRFLQTEALALAGTLWLFAALLSSIQNRKLKLLEISAALIFTSFIRLDAVALIIPICYTAFYISNAGKAVKNLIVIGLIVAIPWGGWMMRNYHVGLNSVLPQGMTTPDGGAEPKGYLLWIRTWMTNTYHNTNSQWPVNRLVYSSTSIDPEIFISDQERETVQNLLGELAMFDGQPFPIHIDDEFRLLAQNRINERPLEVFITNPLRRTFSMWSNPFNSFGWPTMMDGNFSKSLRIEIAKGDLKKLISVALDNPGIAFNKAFIAVWRLSFLLAFAFILLQEFFVKSKLRPLILSTTCFIIGKSLIAGWLNPETRYIMTAIPLIEASVLSFLFIYWPKYKLSFFGQKNPKYESI